jgi:hypothetical protein
MFRLPFRSRIILRSCDGQFITDSSLPEQGIIQDKPFETVYLKRQRAMKKLLFAQVPCYANDAGHNT